MNFKIDTKEKFQELYLLDEHVSANMTGELLQLLSELQNSEPFNIILSMKPVTELAPEAASTLAECQGKYYEAGHSFVICELNAAVEKQLEDAELLESMNITPTMSEAWDIVQMEEIERDLLDGFDE
ncbi:MAG TPA: STAS domain-containing protein [Phnomibacter sp.]|nr:STAS domain-containing protein [Phnomibacter sp.]